MRRADLRVARGEIVALCGANGAGKTSLLKLASGVLRPDDGVVRYEPPGLRVALVPDKAALYDDWPVGVFLNWYAHSLGVADPASRLPRVIAQCGLEQVLEERCGVLSHGYRQRVSLAQALVSSPDLLLLDEPTNALDVSQRRALREILEALSADCGILFADHDYGEVALLAERLYFLKHARCREIALPARGGEHVWACWRDAGCARQAIAIGGACYGRYSAHRFCDAPSRARLMARLGADAAVLEIHRAMPPDALATLLESADG